MNDSAFGSFSTAFADERLLLEVIHLAQQQDPSERAQGDESYLHWLCLQGPYGRAEVASIRVEGALAAVALLIPVRLTEGAAEERPGFFVVNVLTERKYRGRGLFASLAQGIAEHARETGRWALGHPNRAALRGWEKAKMSFLDPLIPRLTMWWPGALVARAAPGEWDQLPSWSEQTRQAREAGAPHRMRVAMPAEFVEWRFRSRPDIEYELYAARQQGKVVGYFIVRPFRARLGLVVDFGIAAEVKRPVCLPWPSIVVAPEGCDSRVLSRIEVRKKAISVFATAPFESFVDTSELGLAPSDF